MYHCFNVYWSVSELGGTACSFIERSFQLLSHGTRFSRNCFANFVADFRTTLEQVSQECRENFHVSRTSRELVRRF